MSRYLTDFTLIQLFLMFYVALSFSPFWNFDIPSNAVIYERAPNVLPPPHPEIEVLRAQLLIKLRTQYQELCHAREGMFLYIVFFVKLSLSQTAIEESFW